MKAFCLCYWKPMAIITIDLDFRIDNEGQEIGQVLVTSNVQRSSIGCALRSWINYTHTMLLT